MRRLGNGSSNSLVPRGFEGLWPSDFFSDFFGSSSLPSFNTGMKTDIRETDDNFIIDIEVPGLRKEDVDISLNDNVLTVSAKIDEQNEEKRDGRYLRRERRSGLYRRSFVVDNVKCDEIEAKMDNGVLTLTLPKMEQTVINDKKIEIR